MIFLDVLGFITSICLAGIRYPQLVILAGCINTAGILLTGAVFHEQINYVIAAGAFSVGVFSKENTGFLNHLLSFSGVFANYIIMSIGHGIEKESTLHLLNPVAQLHAPLSVINMRVAIISFVFNLWNFYYGV